MSQCMLTTMDNPNNPFTHYDEWRAFDTAIEHDYETERWLANFSYASTEMDEEEYNDETSAAIDRFLSLNPFGIHYKIYEDEADVIIPLANEAFRLLKKEILQT